MAPLMPAAIDFDVTSNNDRLNIDTLRYTVTCSDRVRTAKVGAEREKQ